MKGREVKESELQNRIITETESEKRELIKKIILICRFLPLNALCTPRETL